MYRFFCPAAFVMALLLAGCGGGGGAGAGTDTSLPPAAPQSLSQIEFVVDVSHGGVAILPTITVTVRPAVPNCMVLTAAGCDAPKRVAGFIDGSFAFPVDSATAPSENQTYTFTIPFVNDAGTHGVSVLVADKTGNTREGWLAFGASGAAQAGFFGRYTEAGFKNSVSSENFFGHVGSTKQIRSTPIAGAQPILRLLQVPTGSASALVPDPQDPWQASLKLDRIGNYVVESAPMFGDGRSVAPTHYKMRAAPFNVTFNWSLEYSANPREVPAVAPENARLAIEAFATDPRKVASVEAFLNGASLGKLTAPNVQERFGSQGSSPPDFLRPLYSFDIARESLNPPRPTLRIVTTDTSGFQADRTWTIGSEFNPTGNFDATDPSLIP